MKDILKAVQKHSMLMYANPESTEERRHLIRELCLNTVVEVVEILNELPWKNWKPIKSQKNNTLGAIEEVADAVIFLCKVYLTLVQDLEGDIEGDFELKEVILKKIKMNTERLKSGEHISQKGEKYENDNRL